MTISTIKPNSLGGAPCFSAYIGTTQSGMANGTWTKVTCQTEEYDTNSNYDNATNYRFTPTVAGYYQLNGSISMGGSTITTARAAIYKNGSLVKLGNYITNAASGLTAPIVSVTVFLNGSTDYVELFGQVSSSGTNSFYSDNTASYFQGSFVRGA